MVFFFITVGTVCSISATTILLELKGAAYVYKCSSLSLHAEEERRP